MSWSRLLKKQSGIKDNHTALKILSYESPVSHEYAQRDRPPRSGIEQVDARGDT